jgi:nitrile hydratase accessory protein
MNGIHDMGGMQGMGPIEYETNEPVFHAAWEARVYAMNSAVTATGKLMGGLRPPIESLTALEYLRMSYYEKWLTSLTERMVASALVTRAEIENGHPAEGSASRCPRSPRPMCRPSCAGSRPGATIQSLHASRSASMCARVTSIRSPIRACPVMPGAKPVRSSATAASRLFPTPTSMAWATSRSTSTRFASRRANYGALRPHRRTQFISNCGTIILSQPDSALQAERIAALPHLPREKDGPAFAEPWEAQAFALAVKLSEQGHFTWKEWAATLGDELKAAADRGEPDDGSRYYHYWLAALERLVTAKGLTDRAALETRREAWADAYRHTPHGKPVELAAASSGPQHQ